MIPRILHFTVPDRIAPEQQRAIEQAAELHPHWEVKVWRDPLDPADFRLSGLWPRVNSGAQLADLIRIEVVHRYGGVYLDSDVWLRKSLDDLAEHHQFFVASEDGQRATNAVFGATRGHPALETMIEELHARPPDWTLPPTVTTGPEFFSRVLRWRGDVTLLPRETFYPHNWNERPGAVAPQTYGVHQWRGSWKDRSIGARVAGILQRISFERIVRELYRRGVGLYRSSEAAIRLLSPRVDAYPASGHVVRRTIHGHRLILDAGDVSITPELVRNGYYELREELLLRRCLRGGDFFVDVGANVGVFSLLAASLVGPFGRVYAYEPNPTASALLSKAAVMNWMHDRLIVREAAVGAEIGKTELKFHPARLGDAAVRTDAADGGTFSRTAAYLGGVQTVGVPVVALDREFPCDIPIKFLKIDAEGHEAEVIEGARRLLESHCIEYLMLEAVREVAGSAWQRLLEVAERLCATGYEPFSLGWNGTLVPTSLTRIECGRTAGSRNVVFRSSRLRDAAVARSSEPPAAASRIRQVG